MSARTFSLTMTAALLLSGVSHGAIEFDTIIGSPGTDAATVAGAGNAVNTVGTANNFGATTLSTTGISFNFNTGFADSQDRVVGFNSAHVFSDMKSNSLATPAGPLIFDKNNNAFTNEETDETPSDPSTFHLGLGMHADAFVTFDMDVIRANAGLTGSGMMVTGGVGAANPVAGAGATSGAILLDGVVLGVWDWNNNSTNDFATYVLGISSAGRFLTFIGMSGTDLNPDNAHVGFSDVQAQVPEPGCAAAIATLGLALSVGQQRRSK